MAINDSWWVLGQTHRNAETDNEERELKNAQSDAAMKN